MTRVSYLMERGVLTASAEDVRDYVRTQLQEGSSPREAAEAMREGFRGLCEDMLALRAFLTETLLAARRLLEGYRCLEEDWGWQPREAELLLCSSESAFINQHYAALTLLAKGLGFRVTNLGGGFREAALPALWAAHPQALGLLVYGGCELSPPFFSACCLGHSRLTAATPRCSLRTPEALLREPLPEDLRRILRLAVILDG